MGWTEDWLNWTGAYQLAGYQCDLMRAACAKNGYPFGMYNILAGRSPWEIVAKGFTEAGHGATVIRFFNYGPHYTITSDTNSRNSAIYAPIKRLSFALGAVENQLLSAKVARGDVAMLYSNTSDIWGTLKKGFGANTNGLERTYMHLLLTHSGYRVDILYEESLESGELDKYKLLFVNGTHLRKSVAPILERWVADGGTICVNAGALRFDEFNRPLRLLEKMGSESGEVRFEQTPGRPPYEVPTRKVIGQVEFADYSAFPVVCVRENLPTGKPIAQFKDGRSAVVERIFGKGKIVRFGFLLAISYLREAILKDKILKKEKTERWFYSCRWYPEAQRALIRSIVSSVGVEPRISTSDYLVDAAILDSPNHLVLSLANWTGSCLKNLNITLRGGGRFKRVTNIRNEVLKPVYENNAMTLRMDLSEGDFILCEK
jgi:hypothetical protein